jgi:hypothetical protein
MIKGNSLFSHSTPLGAVHLGQIVNKSVFYYRVLFILLMLAGIGSMATSNGPYCAVVMAYLHSTRKYS